MVWQLQQCCSCVAKYTFQSLYNQFVVWFCLCSLSSQETLFWALSCSRVPWRRQFQSCEWSLCSGVRRVIPATTDGSSKSMVNPVQNEQKLGWMYKWTTRMDISLGCGRFSMDLMLIIQRDFWLWHWQLATPPTSTSGIWKLWSCWPKSHYLGSRRKNFSIF